MIRRSCRFAGRVILCRTTERGWAAGPGVGLGCCRWRRRGVWAARAAAPAAAGRYAAIEDTGSLLSKGSVSGIVRRPYRRLGAQHGAGRTARLGAVGLGPHLNGNPRGAGTAVATATPPRCRSGSSPAVDGDPRLPAGSKRNGVRIRSPTNRWLGVPRRASRGPVRPGESASLRIRGPRVDRRMRRRERRPGSNCRLGTARRADPVDRERCIGAGRRARITNGLRAGTDRSSRPVRPPACPAGPASVRGAAATGPRAEHAFVRRRAHRGPGRGRGPGAWGHARSLAGGTGSGIGHRQAGADGGPTLRRGRNMPAAGTVARTAVPGRREERRKHGRVAPSGPAGPAATAILSFGAEWPEDHGATAVGDARRAQGLWQTKGTPKEWNDGVRETGWAGRSGSADPGVGPLPWSEAIRRVGHGPGSSALDERTRLRDGPPRRAGPSQTDPRAHYAPRGPLGAASKIGDPRVRARLAKPSAAGSSIRLSIEGAPRIEPLGAYGAGTGPTRLPAWPWGPARLSNMGRTRGRRQMGALWAAAEPQLRVAGRGGVSGPPRSSRTASFHPSKAVRSTYEDGFAFSTGEER